MAGESAFKVEGIVVETMPNRLYRVELSNGHRVLAYATGKAKLSFAAKTGDKVKLQMSPYDLSEGRIIVETVTK
ncbi:MAG TPA: translation initiation factor IF-1 [Verrucomicrobiae bacterium]|nr:translation initiation factor IF-1 [Verrucomicrobiae bacterium]